MTRSRGLAGFSLTQPSPHLPCSSVWYIHIDHYCRCFSLLSCTYLIFFPVRLSFLSFFLLRLSKTVFVHCIILEYLYSVYSLAFLSFVFLFEEQWCSIIYLSLPLYIYIYFVVSSDSYAHIYVLIFLWKKEQTHIRIMREREKAKMIFNTHTPALCMFLDISK